MSQMTIKNFFSRVPNGNASKTKDSISSTTIGDLAKPGTSRQCIKEDEAKSAKNETTKKRKRSKVSETESKSKRIPMQDLPDPVNGENQQKVSSGGSSSDESPLPPAKTIAADKNESPATSKGKSPAASKGKSPATSKGKSPAASKSKSPAPSKGKSPTTGGGKSIMEVMMDKAKAKAKDEVEITEEVMSEVKDSKKTGKRNKNIEDSEEEEVIMEPVKKKSPVRQEKKAATSKSKSKTLSSDEEEEEAMEVDVSPPPKKTGKSPRGGARGKKGSPKEKSGKGSILKVDIIKKIVSAVEEEKKDDEESKVKQSSRAEEEDSAIESEVDEEEVVPVKKKRATKIRRMSSSSEEDEDVKPEPPTPESPKAKGESSGKPIHSFFGERNRRSEFVLLCKHCEQSKCLPEGSCKGGQKKVESKAPVKKDDQYNPSKSSYHPIDDAIWSRGESVPYLALARTLELIEGTSARLKIIDIMANYLRSVIVLSPEDLLPSLYLCLNKLAPAWEGIELGVAETTLMRAVAQSTGRTLSGVKEEAVRKGDLGLVAEGARGSQSKLAFTSMASSSRLTLKKVMSELKEIAALSGNAAMSKKMYRIVTLFVACRGPEMRYLVRSLSGKLRVGLAEQSVLQALALACTFTPPGQDKDVFPPSILDDSNGKGTASESFKAKVDANALIVKTAYCECPSFERLVSALLDGGLKALPERCQLSPGLPPKPMLAHPTKGVQEVLTRFDNRSFTCEYKYDGERAQVHLLEDGRIKIFSRNQEDNTTKYPDVIGRLSTCIRTCSERDDEEAKLVSEKESKEKDVESEGDREIKSETVESENEDKKEDYSSGGDGKEVKVKKEVECDSKENEVDEEKAAKTFILDCEAVAWDVETQCILPFQKLATRKKKDADEAEIKVQVCLFLFDLLYLNGKSLVSEPLSLRRHLLRSHFKAVPGHFHFASSMDTTSTEDVETFLDEAVKGNCEGLMVKTLDVEATYQIARRSRNWLKLKKDYLEGSGGIGDSLDLVVIGGYPGKGKRTGNYGGFLLACFDPESETYQSICKIGTGFSEEDLASLSESLRPNVLSEPRPYYSISPGLHPPPRDWFDATAVWEVKCADLSLSPVHRAGIGLVDPEKGISLRFPRFKRVRDDKKPEEATTSEQVAEMYEGQEQVKNNQQTKTLNEEDFY